VKKVNSLWAKGGPGTPNLIKKVDESLLPPLEVLNIEEIQHELKTTQKIMKRIKDFLEARRKIIENTPSRSPVNGYILQRFGMSTSPYTFQREYSRGLEICAFPGAEIRATAPGKVQNIKWHSKYGLTISIKHKYGFTSYYSHCQRVSIEAGQKVEKNEVIGYVGRSGKATRHMCFYQIKIGTKFIDPLPYLNRL